MTGGGQGGRLSSNSVCRRTGSGTVCVFWAFSFLLASLVATDQSVLPLTSRASRGLFLILKRLIFIFNYVSRYVSGGVHGGIGSL